MIKRIVLSVLFVLMSASVGWSALADQSQWDFIRDTSVSITSQTYSMLDSFRVVIDSAGGIFEIEITGEAIMDESDMLYLAVSDSGSYAAATYGKIINNKVTSANTDTLILNNEFIMSGLGGGRQGGSHIPFHTVITAVADSATADAGGMLLKLSGHTGGSGYGESVTIRNLVMKVLINMTKTGQTTTPKEL